MCPEGYALASQTDAGTGEMARTSRGKAAAGGAVVGREGSHSIRPRPGALASGQSPPDTPPVDGRGSLAVPKRSSACCLSHSAEAGSH